MKANVTNEQKIKLAQLSKELKFQDKNPFGLTRPDFCEGRNIPSRSSDSTPRYWIVLKDFTYNFKQDRYVCSTSGIQTQEVVADTNIKKGDFLNRNFRYENAVQTLVNNGVIMKASEYNPNSLGFGDPIKDKKWLLYVVLAVAGYFAYKKFKK